MQNSFSSVSESSVADPSARKAIFAKAASLALNVFLGISVLAIFIPMNPKMPIAGLDGSWQYAMNQGVARHMSIGRNIVFTYGPYASITTRVYDPATDLRMLLGSLLLAVSYAMALSFMARGRKRYLVLILFLFLATFGSGETLLFSYAFLLVVCVLKYINSDDLSRGKVLPLWQAGAVFVMWVTLGLLPLVKGSLLLPYAASVGICAALLVYRKRLKQGLILLFIPILASLVFWVIADQPLSNIPAFLKGTALLTSGYTEAMSTEWVVLPAIAGDAFVIAFLALSVIILLSVKRSAHLSATSRGALALLLAVYLLVTFKHGFVAVMAVTTVFSTLSVLVLIIGLLHVDRYLVWCLTLSIVISFGISIVRDPVLVNEVHERFGVGAAGSSGTPRRDILEFCVARAPGAYVRMTLLSTWNAYRAAWDGLYVRVARRNALNDQFVEANEVIRRENPLPALTGSTDMYEDEISVLLASKNQWNPRPVFESYSAYTPELARLNEQHLRGQDAPDWIFFRVESIDQRLPSLDDGLSWPALLDNYSFDSYSGQFALLHKNQQIHPSSNYIPISERECKTGDAIAIPDSDGLLFARVNLRPTLAGRLLITFLNPPQLHITLKLEDGTTKKYRVISEMMTTGFVISPLVENTDQFASLAAGKLQSVGTGRVRSISITPSYGGSLFWSGTYSLALNKYSVR
jgi:hypothetical protein